MSVLLGPIAIGILSNLFFGRIGFIEILSLAWLFASVVAKPSIIAAIFSIKYARVGLSLVSSFFLFISDIVNQSTFEVLVKGVGAFILFPLAVLFLVKAFGFKKLSIVYLAFLLSSAFLNRADSDIIFSADTFKSGFFGAAIALVLLVFSYLPERLKSSKSNINLLSIVGALVLVAASVWGNLRLLSLVTILSYFIAAYYQRLACSLKINMLSPIAASFLFPVVVLFISISLSIAASVVLDFLTFLPEGLISEVAIAKTREQFTGSFGLLFGGRSEIFSSLIAWKQKWLLGWGSWAVDPNDQFELAGLESMINFGYQPDLEQFSNLVLAGLSHVFIPTHSPILSLLVWGGILSVIPFYIFVASFVSIFLQSISTARASPPFFVAFVFVYSLWNMLFSPFSYGHRVGLALSCALVISYAKEKSCSQHETPAEGGIRS